MNDSDIRKLSVKAFQKFDIEMEKQDNSGSFSSENHYFPNKTIFLTSPRGGYNVLSEFSYANGLGKRNLPFDLYKEKEYNQTILNSNSLPYSYTIQDVNDIVIVDDIYMSGEQANEAIQTINSTIDNLKISVNQKPRIHYISLIGQKNKDFAKGKYHTFTVGKEYSFEKEYNPATQKNEYIDISAIIFPFSISDDHFHSEARSLYYNKWFKHL